MSKNEFRADVSHAQGDNPLATRRVQVSTIDGEPITAFDVDGGREEVERRIAAAGYGVVSWNGETAHLRKAKKSNLERVLNSFLIQFLMVLAIVLVIVVVWSVAGSAAEPVMLPSHGHPTTPSAPQAG